jgi:hypothetical protein
MRSVRIGGSPARHFVVGESDEPIWPLHFTGAAAAVDAPEHLYSQVSLAVAEGVRLFSVELAMGSFIEHGGLWPAAIAMLQRVVALAPRGFVIIRASFDGGATLGMEKETLMSAVNGSTMLSGCAYVAEWNTTDCASPTAAWAKAAGGQLRRMLVAADNAIPGAVAGVQLAGLSTGEWELPHDDFVATNGTFRWFPGYSKTLAKEWCERQGEAAGCHVPSAAERNAPTVGNSFVTASSGAGSSSGSGNASGVDLDVGARAVAFARFSAMTVARTLSTLCDAAKNASGGRIFTFAFYGYIINSATNIQFAGHAAAEFLLSQPSIDGISSPTLYAPSSRSPVGAVITHGPWNTPAIHDKTWVVEADLRTVLAAETDLRMYGNSSLSFLNSTLQCADRLCARLCRLRCEFA